MDRKWLILGSSILTTSLLSGCATMLTMHEIKDREHNIKNLYTDQLIAYGIPKTPIPSYENALAVVGTKNNYLIKPVAQSLPNPNLLVDVVTQLDLNYLSIMPRSVTKDKIFEITLTDPKVPLTETLVLYYTKPNQKITAIEKQQLQTLKFSCGVTQSNDSYSCIQYVTYNIYPIKKADNAAPPQHQFRQPIQLEVKQKTKKSVLNKAFYFPLLPLAAVVDIVTLPVQYMLFSEWL